MSQLKRIILSLGSNLGDRYRFINESITLLSELTINNKGEGFRESKLYETISLTNSNEEEDHAPYLNKVISLDTDMNPLQLLQFTQKVERTLGREPNSRPYFSARPIDVDILDYGGLIINHVNLNIPHQELHRRDFVLVPLKDIAPKYVHPVFNKSIDELLMVLKERFVLQPVDFRT